MANWFLKGEASFSAHGPGFCMRARGTALSSGGDDFGGPGRPSSRAFVCYSCRSEVGQRVGRLSIHEYLSRCRRALGRPAISVLRSQCVARNRKCEFPCRM